VDAGLDSFLQPWDVRLGNDMVVDLQDYVAGKDPTNLYVTRFQQNHPIGKGMGSLATVLPTARRIAVAVKQTNPNVFTSNFMHTSGDGWAVAYQGGATKLAIDKNRDKHGAMSLGIACERFQEYSEPGRDPLRGRLVVIGDSDFIKNQYVDMAGNLNLFLNCVDWLAGRQDLVSVRPKLSDVRWMTLTATQTKGVLWVSVLIVPAAAVLAGVAMIRWRRARA
jgi:ABC-type uncharacterized transport system involved in gliding motility auxiliary subunit